MYNSISISYGIDTNPDYLALIYCDFVVTFLFQIVDENVTRKLKFWSHFHHLFGTKM